MFDIIGVYWQYAILLPIGYIVKMVITNNKSIQEIKQEMAKNFVSNHELDKHEQRIKDYIHDFKIDVTRIEKKLDDLIMYMKK